MLRLALAQLHPRKAAYRDNLAQLGAVFREVAGWPEAPDLLLAPESALTGYFLEGGVRELALPAEEFYQDLSRVHGEAAGPPLDIAIGFYEVWQNRLHNSSLYATLGGDQAGIRHIHRKVFLPTYGVFDEERFVEPGRSVQAFDTRWGRAAMLICEDAWHSLTATLAALDGAQMIIIPSATPGRGISPEARGRPDNLQRWERLAKGIAEEHGVFVALVQLVGFEGGKGFAGGSILVNPRGELLAELPLFQSALEPVTIDLDDITRARADSPLLSDLEVKLPGLLQAVGRSGGQAAGEGVSENGQIASAPPNASPRNKSADRPSARPPDRLSDPLAIDPALTRRWLVEFIRDELPRRRGFDKAIVGLSGGVDSSLVAFLAAEALGAENVIGVRMPYRTSSPESMSHAQLVIDQLGIEGCTVEISAAVDGLVEAVGGSDDTRRGNVMARTRMIVLFDLSAARKALPLGTGNKTERLFGYFTWHADDSPPVNPIGDLFKSQVWALARHVGVPEVIVDKPASADLIHGQTDEGDLGISYPKADHILHLLLQGYTPEEVTRLGYSEAEVALVRKRLESTHWKRRLPTVAMLSQTAIGEYYLRPVDY